MEPATTREADFGVMRLLDILVLTTDADGVVEVYELDRLSRHPGRSKLTP